MKNNIIISVIILLLAFLGLLFFNSHSQPRMIPDDPRLKKIVTSGEINVGMALFYPPIVFIENEELKGLDPDIIREVASDLGVEINFKFYPWEDLFQALLDDEVDVIIAAITITSKRSEIMSFSNPYFNAGQVLVTNIDSNILGIQDLSNERIGVQKETTSEIEAFKYVEGELVYSFENYNFAREALLGNEIDVIIIDYPAGFDMVHRYEGLKIAGDPFTQEFYGIATQREEKELLNEINRTIRRIKRESIMEQIENRWLIN